MHHPIILPNVANKLCEVQGFDRDDTPPLWQGHFSFYRRETPSFLVGVSQESVYSHTICHHRHREALAVERWFGLPHFYTFAANTQRQWWASLKAAMRRILNVGFSKKNCEQCAKYLSLLWGGANTGAPHPPYKKTDEEEVIRLSRVECGNTLFKQTKPNVTLKYWDFTPPLVLSPYRAVTPEPNDYYRY